LSREMPLCEGTFFKRNDGCLFAVHGRLRWADHTLPSVHRPRFRAPVWPLPTCTSPLAPVVAGDDAAPEARAVVMRL
jgi:hypothetical protein